MSVFFPSAPAAGWCGDRGDRAAEHQVFWIPRPQKRPALRRRHLAAALDLLLLLRALGCDRRIALAAPGQDQTRASINPRSGTDPGGPANPSAPACSLGQPLFTLASAHAAKLLRPRQTSSADDRSRSTERLAMRIGIDGSCLSNRGGFGRFSRQLLEALSRQPTEHDFTVFVDRPSSPEISIPDRFERAIVAVHEAPSRAASSRGSRRFLDMLAMGRAVARRGLDLMYFPATYSFFPVWNAGKLVVTMHDTLPLAHPELVFPSRCGRLAWQIKETAAVRLADRIVTVSEASRNDIAAWSGVPTHRIRVITEGPDRIFAPGARDAEANAVLGRIGIKPNSRFLLYVGGLSPHKNLLRLVEAFAQGRPRM